MSNHYKYQKQNGDMGAQAQAQGYGAGQQNMGGMRQGMYAAQNQAPQNPYINPQAMGDMQQGMYGIQNQAPQNMQNMAPRAANPYYQENYYYQSNPYMPSPKSSFNIFGETPSDKLLRGLLIGGAAAYILTNENAQKAIIKTGVKLFETLAGGVEEFKEKIMDAKAELEAEKEEEAELSEENG